MKPILTGAMPALAVTAPGTAEDLDDSAYLALLTCRALIDGANLLTLNSNSLVGAGRCAGS
jgi:hypothetical protein